ncbi:MAG: transposase [Caldisericaceae bacterium]|nr:transposase [Caldisericaceae bacterium]
MLSIGIDISKKKVDVAVYDGMKYISGTYENSAKGVKAMLREIKKIKTVRKTTKEMKKTNRQSTKQSGKESIESIKKTKQTKTKANLNLIFVMEATGVYHLTYADTLYELGYHPCVVNPLIIKRYGEEKLRRAKTDKADAKLISEFGYNNIIRVIEDKIEDEVKNSKNNNSSNNSNNNNNGSNSSNNSSNNIKNNSSNNNNGNNSGNNNNSNNNPSPDIPYLYKPNSKISIKIKLMLKAIEQLHALKNRNINHMEALKQHKEEYTKDIAKIFNNMNNSIDKDIKKLEEKIDKLIRESDEYKNMYEKLLTIPGIGERTAGALIGYFDTFDNFENAKQVAAYIGLNPGIKQSGTSIRIKGKISRIGNSYLRKLFYMDALSASRYNTQCKLMYKRLSLKGKDKPQILMAVGHKLLRQAFAIAKYGRTYDPNY